MQVKYLVALGAAFVAAAAAYPTYNYLETDKSIGTVIGKERVVKNDDSYYVVYTKNQAGETVSYKIVDSLTAWDFRASDRYGELKEGQAYEFTTDGWRWGLMSMYRNILKAEPIQ